MDWLNYHLLLYFWTVAREQCVSKAAAMLHVAQPPVSTQVRSLERSLGQKLFERQGRQLWLTSDGEKVLRSTDEIVTLGRELLQTAKGRAAGGAEEFSSRGLRRPCPS